MPATPTDADLTAPPPTGVRDDRVCRDVPLPRCVSWQDDGLYVVGALLEPDNSLLQFVERVLATPAFFRELDYPLLMNLLYEPEAARQTRATDGGQPLRLARDIVGFEAERTKLYQQVRISADGTRADYVVKGLARKQADELHESTRLDADEFIAAMWTEGVRFGIDLEALRAAAGGKLGERLHIASALPTVTGIDAGVVEQTDILHRDDAPKVLANGRIDLRQFINHFPQVAANTRLLKKTPRQLGKPGRDVRGQVIEPPLPKDFELESLAGHGTRVERGADGEFLVAVFSGFVHIDTESNQISITDKIISRHGISLRTTGNLTLTADFEEHGEVQERRQVSGHNMIFLADVFGELRSNGGVIELKESLAGGKAINPGGKIDIVGTASRSTVEAQGGEIAIGAAESCLIIGSKVQIKRAVNCEILAEEVDIESCEGCAVAARTIHIGTVGSRRDAESVVTMLRPDESAWKREAETLEKRIAENRLAREEKQRATELISAKPEVQRFLSLRQKVDAGEVTINTEQQQGWASAQARFAVVTAKLTRLHDDMGALEKQEQALRQQLHAIEATRRAALEAVTCTLDSVTGDTVVRAMTVAAEGFPLGDVSPKELHKRLRSHGTVQDRLFSGRSGAFKSPSVPETQVPMSMPIAAEFDVQPGTQ